MNLFFKIIFWFFISLEVAIWPMGVYLMIIGHSPDAVGGVMATLILFAMPLFAVTN